MQGHPPFFLTDSSKGRPRKDSTVVAGDIFLSDKLYNQSYYACVCGYHLHALKLLACTVKFLPRTVKLLACTVKLLPRAVKLFANAVTFLPYAVKSLANAVKLLPRIVKHLYSTVTFYLYARNCPEC